MCREALRPADFACPALLPLLVYVCHGYPDILMVAGRLRAARDSSMGLTVDYIWAFAGILRYIMPLLGRLAVIIATLAALGRTLGTLVAGGQPVFRFHHGAHGGLRGFPPLARP